MKRHALIILLALSAVFCFSGAAFAALDQFVGDTAIYSGSTEYLRPNVLFIVDNNSTMNDTASSEPYDKNTVYSGSYNTWDVYKLTGQANYVLHVSNSTSDLGNVTCQQAKAALQNYGTYTGGGSDALKSQGVCGRGGAGTTYLGNLLNFNESTSTESGASQIDIIREAVTNVVGGARYGVNFGFMVFGSNNKGGDLVISVGDLSGDTEFNNFVSQIPNPSAGTGVALLSGDSRPVAEALYDARYYFDKDRTGTTLPISADTVPASPLEYTCQKNFVVFITNGDTVGDSDPTLCDGVVGVGDYDGDGHSGDVCSANTYGRGTHLLDDVAKYAYEEDLSVSFEGLQSLATHTVLVFSPEKALLRRAADNSHGRGSYKLASNANELSKALLEVMSNIVLEADTSFVAPVVPTSPENRTYSGERVYLGFFKPISQKPWHGNLKKYGIDSQNRIVDKNDQVAIVESGEDEGSFKDSAVSFWSSSADGGIVEEGGAGEVLLGRDFSVDPRKIYSYLCTSGNHKVLTHEENQFLATNAKLTNSRLDVDTDTEKAELVDYIHGLDPYDEDGDTITNEKRDWILGDILHSKPQIVNYNTYAFSTANEKAVTGTGASSYCTTNKTMIYVGTNDGMLHAFRDCDGKEEWAFIPDNLLPNLKELAERPAQHTFFVDSSPIVYTYDHDKDGNIGPSERDDGDLDDGSDDKVLLLFGQRRGGNAYYALDVTDPAAPEFLWKIDSSTTGFSELGETWSEPQLATVKVGTAEKIVAFIGAGYDVEEDGRYGDNSGAALYFPATPTQDKGEGNATSSGTVNPTPYTNRPNAKGRGVYALQIATLDTNGVPTVATVPTKVWGYTSSDNSWLKFSIPSDIAVLDTDYDGYADRLYVGDTGGRMWRFNVAGTDTSNWSGNVIFFSGAQNGRKIFYRPSVALETGYTLLAFGTGDRAHPLNTAVVDRLYVVKDRGQVTTNFIQENNLEDVTENYLQAANPEAAPETCTAGNNSIKCILERLNDTSNYGWYIKLDRLNDNNQHAGEKVLASALVFNKVAYYTTYTPNTDASTDPCSPGNLGVSRLYAVDYKTGEAVLNFANATSGVNNDTESTANNTRALSKEGKVLRKADRTIDLGVGIPSGLVVIMPPSGDAKLLIGCGGGLCSEDPVMGGTIIPIYWMSW